MLFGWGLLLCFLLLVLCTSDAFPLHLFCSLYVPNTCGKKLTGIQNIYRMFAMCCNNMLVLILATCLLPKMDSGY